MDEAAVIGKTQDRLQKLETQFQSELGRLRSGQANPSLLDGILVEVHETKLPLNQVSSIVATEANLLQINPFDKNNIEAIVSAINSDQQLDLNPTDDGRRVYVPIPPLTSERRQLLVRKLGQLKEDFLIRLRRIRHQALADLETALKSESERQLASKRLQTSLDQSPGQTDCLGGRQANRNHGFMTVPRHLGIILDGNRRWAKNRRLPSLEGHRRGLPPGRAGAGGG